MPATAGLAKVDSEATMFTPRGDRGDAKEWCAQQDLNLQPLAPEANALSN